LRQNDGIGTHAANCFTVHAVCKVVGLMQIIVQTLLLLPISSTVREQLARWVLGGGLLLVIGLVVYAFGYSG
jgi:hypothetical protein